MKKPTSVLFATALLVSATFACMAQAQGNGSIVVFRGAETETVRFDNRGGVTVVRGQPAANPVEPVRKAAHPSVRRIRAGNTLWVVDGGGKRLVACQVRNTTQVDGRRIRCVDRALPVALR